MTRLAALFLALPVTALAGAIVVPEIDATSATAALGLLAGAVMILRGRRNNKLVR